MNHLTYNPIRTPTVRENIVSAVVDHIHQRDDETPQEFQQRRNVLTENTRQLRIHGIGDNAVNYQRWLEESIVYRQLIFDNVNIPPFNTPIVVDSRAAAMIYIYTAGRLLDQRIDVPGLRKALTCAEFLMPMVNVALLTPEAESRAILVASVKALFRNQRRLNQEIRNLDVLWAAATTEDPETHTRPIDGLWNNIAAASPFGDANPIPGNLTMDDARIDHITPEEAMMYLLFFASHFQQTTLPVELLATVYVSCAKQGQITPDFANKIETGIQDELGKQITIDSESVQLLFTHFGKNFDEQTAEPAFNRWTAMLPESALRLRLTIEQITFSRLTVFKVVEEAIQLFPDFPWPRINKLIPGEMANFVIAAGLINHNPYYGFRKNIGEAASTRYKNLGWVGKELLIQGAEKGTLRNYQGWPRNVPNQERLARIIREYLQDKAEAGVVADGDMAIANQALSASIPNFVDGYKSTPATSTTGPKTGIITVTNWGD